MTLEPLEHLMRDMACAMTATGSAANGSIIRKSLLVDKVVVVAVSRNRKESA